MILHEQADYDGKFLYDHPTSMLGRLRYLPDSGIYPQVLSVAEKAGQCGLASWLLHPLWCQPDMRFGADKAYWKSTMEPEETICHSA